MAPGRAMPSPRSSLDSVEVLAHQLLEAHLGASPQLSHDLPGTESTQLTATLQGFPLGVGVQETTGVEIAGPRGVHEIAEAEDADVPALVSKYFNIIEVTLQSLKHTSFFFII